MNTSTDARASLSPAPARMGRPGGICLVLAGIAFFAGGATHPADGGGGTKVEQLYQAFIQPAWYSSHALLLASFGLFAAAILLLRRRGDLGPGMARLVNVVSVVAVVATLGMAVHLLSALGAESIADGQASLIYEVQKWNETILNTLWGLGIIALAVAGGLTRTLGNWIAIPLAVVGGVAWCLATATIAFTDRFDPLFPVASLISVWAVAVGLMWAARAK
jgi:hypothetical protein